MRYLFSKQPGCITVMGPNTIQAQMSGENLFRTRVLWQRIAIPYPATPLLGKLGLWSMSGTWHALQSLPWHSAKWSDPIYFPAPADLDPGRRVEVWDQF